MPRREEAGDAVPRAEEAGDEDRDDIERVLAVGARRWSRSD
jgi:hypothetical protein